MTAFSDMKLGEALCSALKKKGIKEATPVQEQAIPAARKGLDLIVQAQTGTGKTLAFLLPIMEKLKTGVAATQALVITPTRELAIQISKVAAYTGAALGVDTLVIYGGQDIERQKQRLRRHPQLIVGTPGRLLDHVRRQTIDLSQVNRVVLDEADEMLKLGFIEDVELLLEKVAADRQLMLFSATIPDRIRGLAVRYMSQPEEIRIKSQHVTLDAIQQVIINTNEEEKLNRLCEEINKHQPYLAMIFCSTKQRVGQLAMKLAARGYLVDELHGDLTQVQRALVLKRFRAATLQLLVATDIAARGLDIEGVTHVFNYDIPRDTESYIHRIGRTGRAGQQGMAITFVNPRQQKLLQAIEAGIHSRITKERSERRHERPKVKKPQDKPIQDSRAKKISKPKPLSKYANRKGASHKGRNDRSRRQRRG